MVDILVKIAACAVNPVDTKIRQGAFPAADITGFDAAGVVETVGANVKGFKQGDEVFYSGVLGRPGSTAQYNLVDYRVSALKPRTLDWATAAAVPLVSLTAWELLADHWGLQVDDPEGVQVKKSILIINGAGGVGSIATQFARKIFKLGKVIVTASREETIEHAKQMGATHTIDHHKPLKDQIQKNAGVEGVEYIFICHSTNNYMQQAVDIASPWGKIGSIVEVSEPLPALHTPDAFMKSLSFTWELMLCKGVYNYDLESQGAILKQVAELYDAGRLTSLVSEKETLSVANLVKAHEKLESGMAIGKIAFEVGDDIQ
ncbi:NAD(P)-binding protein [Teratosphaeria nubilosa]|uniref:NAD(P)-binding protein n=1 Tax=Teratosphaeria nubilosa TaxID=161662 RepID=A0A6G1L0H3_9PEZI|nr:NAD(P)-binding protein [Teratosphaeria nubilosa]